MFVGQLNQTMAWDWAVGEGVPVPRSAPLKLHCATMERELAQTARNAASLLDQQIATVAADIETRIRASHPGAR